MITQLHEATKTPSEYTQSQRLRNGHTVSVPSTIGPSKLKKAMNFSTNKRICEGFKTLRTFLTKNVLVQLLTVMNGGFLPPHLR